MRHGLELPARDHLERFARLERQTRCRDPDLGRGGGAGADVEAREGVGGVGEGGEGGGERRKGGGFVDVEGGC